MIGNLGYGEMGLIVLIILLLFGAKKLPEIGSSLGKSIRMFKKSVKDIQEELPTEENIYTDEEESRPKPRSESHAEDSPPTRDED